MLIAIFIVCEAMAERLWRGGVKGAAEIGGYTIGTVLIVYFLSNFIFFVFEKAVKDVPY